MKQRMRKIVRALVILCFITVLFVHASSNESTHADTKELDRIEVTKDPDKLVYESDDIFDPTGMEITAYYNDGTSAVVTGYSWEPEGGLFRSNTSIRIKYTENSITKGVDLNITVHPALDWIEILTPPDKTVYEEGELFDPAGMVVQATYSDNTTEIITSYDIDFTGGLPTYGETSKDVDITITYSYGYNTKYAYQPITVNRLDSRTLTGLSIEKSPDKTVYKEGEQPDLSGATLIASYDNGKSVQIYYGKVNVVGEQKYNLFTTDSKCTISYTENGVTVSADQEITVNKSSSHLDIITITQNPYKTEYIEGQVFDPTGIEIKATYTDAAERTISRVSSIAPVGALKADDKYVTLYYTENDITKSVQLEITVIKKIPINIAIVTEPAKLIYIEGQMFDKSGMEVKVKYNDESESVVTDYTYTPGAALETTDHNVNIIYTLNGVTVSADQPITVNVKTIQSIVIEKKPDKTEYIEDESFDKTGMVVRANYNNGSYKILDPMDYEIEAEISGDNNSLGLGCTKVKLSYQDNGYSVCTDCPVTVIKKSPSGIEVTTEPAKTEYIEGEIFDPQNMWVTVTYDNGTQTQIEWIDQGLDIPSQKLNTSYTGVKISYTENNKTVETTFGIKVNPKTPVSMEITKNPDKTEYLEGESFDPSGMEVTITYDNGTVMAVEGYTYSAAEPFKTEGSPVGESVSIKYTEDGTTVSYDIFVTVIPKSVVSISVTTPPQRTEYTAGECFDPSGMVVTAAYDNGTFAVIEDYTYSPDGALKTTFTEIDIVYSGPGATVYAKQPVKVNPAPKVLSYIKILKNPDKLQYNEGEQFNPTGMEVLAVYEDGSEKQITEYSISPFGSLAVGCRYVRISYTEGDVSKTADVDIMVNSSDEEKTLERIEIMTPPDRVDYQEGDTFDGSGMTVTLYYSNGTSYQMMGYNYTVEPYNNLTPKDTYVLISCSDSHGNIKTATQPITVKEKVILTGITITTPPTKVEYVAGDEFITSGMIVTATYSDGSTKVIKNADEYIEATPLKNLKVTDTYVTVKYTESDGTVKTATQPITVKINSNNSGAGNSSGNNNSSNSGSGSSYVPISTPTPTPEVPGTTTKEVKNADGSKTTTTRTLEESGKLTVTTIKESKNGDKSTTEVITDASGKMVSTSTETVSTDNKGTTTATTTTRKSDGSVTGTTVKTYESGKVVSTTTETKADKSVKTVNETKQTDGSSSKTVTKISANGSAKQTYTITAPAADGQAAKKTEFVYSVTKNGEAKLVKVTTDKAEITIPATVTINDEKCKVVTIGKEAFKGNTSITKVVIGKYVETIGTKAFAGLKNLEEIYINGSKVNKVSEKAFYKISKDVKFYIKAKKSVCKAIASLITKSGVKKVNYERVK